MKIKILIILSLTLNFRLSTFNCFAQVQYSFIFDQNLSSVASAQNLLTLHKSVYESENLYLKPSLFEENTFVKKTLGIGYRFCKTVLLDNIIDHMTGLVQHEVSGHGARYREFGYKESHYSLHLFYPYGDGHGVAYSGNLPPGLHTSKHEDILKVIGGNEANDILSYELAYKWLARGKINYRESILYLGCFHNLSFYILSTKYLNRNNTGNDINAYIMDINMNESHGTNHPYDIDKLSDFVILDLFNTFQYFAAYTYLKTYLWSGSEEQKIPMIPLKNVQYLPSFRLGLSPFGAEFYFDNFLKKESKILNIYFRYGEPTYHHFCGGGIRSDNIFKYKSLTAGIKIDAWDQPSVYIGGKTIDRYKYDIGGAVAGIVYYKILNKEFPLSLMAQCGYKTAGYLEGEKLSEGAIVRVGICFEEPLKK
ncbi:MAG: hypothetical protein HY958_03235 [Bacteroidia bacterium]|nr:hypothetical protein [Bacteroidia bacterium]